MKEEITALLWEAFMVGIKIGNLIDDIQTSIRRTKEDGSDITDEEIASYLKKEYYSVFEEWFNPKPVRNIKDEVEDIINNASQRKEQEQRDFMRAIERGMKRGDSKPFQPNWGPAVLEGYPNLFTSDRTQP